jgi:hypothetical protein
MIQLKLYSAIFKAILITLTTLILISLVVLSRLIKSLTFFIYMCTCYKIESILYT